LDSLRQAGAAPKDAAANGEAKLEGGSVRTDPWKATAQKNAYGGVVAIALHYSYPKSDGTTGKMTVQVEYLHLITPDFLPKNGQGQITSQKDWQATGKASGFGPSMTNGGRLTAADLSKGPLVGQLGASEFPHVHIQTRLAEGDRSYVSKRQGKAFDPTIVIK
jgi:hypothetical protein